MQTLFQRKVEMGQDGKETAVIYSVSGSTLAEVSSIFSPSPNNRSRNALTTSRNLPFLRPPQFIIDVEGILNVQTKKSISQKKANVTVTAVKPPISHKIHSFRTPPSYTVRVFSKKDTSLTSLCNSHRRAEWI
jgi:hypothetical protein